MGERRGRAKSKDIHEGPMDKDNMAGGLIWEGVGRAGESKGRTTVIEQQ